MIKYNRLNILFLLCFMGSTFVSEAQQKDGFKKIFNGKNMKNWEADTSHWRIENGCFVGEVTKEKPLKTNTFMIYRGTIPEILNSRHPTASVRKATVACNTAARP